MRIRNTEAVRSFLRETSSDQQLPQALRSTAEEWLSSGSVPWGVLRDLSTSVRESRQDDGPWLHEICQSASVEVQTPPRRTQTKSPELQAHLDKLQRKLDQDAYDRMVKDVTEKEREAKARAERGLRTYKKQMSFGLHVLVMMGTFYAFGHVLGMAASSNQIVPLVTGLVGMICALLLESTLFIIRTTVPRQLEMPSGEKGEGPTGQDHGESGLPAGPELQTNTQQPRSQQIQKRVRSCKGIAGSGISQELAAGDKSGEAQQQHAPGNSKKCN